MISLGYKHNKVFYQTMFAIAIPIVIQNLISSSLNLVDNVMIGQLGATNIAAVGLANQFFFIMTLILFGTYSGVSIYIAQYWGNKEYSKVKSVLVIGLTFGVLISLIFFILGFFFNRQLLSIMSDDAGLISLGSDYLRIVSISYILTSISFAFGFSARSIGKAKLPMYASIVSLLINTVLNYMLIFGKFGFDAYGIKGAAVATLIARIVEMIMILASVYTGIEVLALKPKDWLLVKLDFIKQVFKTAFPVILNEGFWSLGMTVYTYVYAHIGTAAMASVQISNILNSLFFVISMGLGNAAAVMLGNQLGADEIERAKDYNKKFLSLGFISGILVCGIIMVSAPFLITQFFNLTPDVTDMTIKTIRVMSLLMPFRFFSTIVIIGTLRSGGDTLYSLILELGCVWLIGVPMAFIGGQFLQLPVYIVVGLVGIEEIMKTLISLPRIASGKWAKRVI